MTSSLEGREIILLRNTSLEFEWNQLKVTNDNYSR